MKLPWVKKGKQKKVISSINGRDPFKDLSISSLRKKSSRANPLPIRVNPKIRSSSSFRGFSRRISRSFGRRSSSLWMTGILILAVVSLGLFFLPKNDAAAWYSDNWAFRKKLTIDSDQVSGTNNLENFPVLVSLSSDTNLSTNAQADGDDILFTDKNGNKLDHEIESYSSGTLVAWVRIPSLSPTTDTDIYMYYGNPGASSQQNATGVWDSNYKGVWHLAEDPSGSAPQIDDSTSNGNNGTSNGGMASEDIITGKIGNGLDLDGSNDYIDVGSDSSIDQLTTITASAWIYSDNIARTSTILGKRGGASIPMTGWFFAQTPSLGNIVFARGHTTANVQKTTGGSSFTQSNWHHIVTTWDGSTNASGISIYIDGALYSTVTPSDGSGSMNSDAALNLLIGAYASGNSPFDGKIDEVKLATGIKSADWIATEYNNQNDPSSFFNVSSQQQRTRGPVAYWKFDDPVPAGTGQEAKDSSGNNNHGTLGTGTSAPTWKTSEFCLSNNCLQFDGSNDYITVSDNNDLDLTNEGTIQAWVKPNNTNLGVGGTIPSWTSLTAPDGASDADNNDGVDFVIVDDNIYYAAYLHGGGTETFSISRSDLDGSNQTEWETPNGTSPDASSSGRETTSVAIASDGTKLYYAVFGHSISLKLMTAYSDLDGSNFSEWTTQTSPGTTDECSTSTMCTIDMTLVNNKLYYVAYLHYAGGIHPTKVKTASSNLDGTNFSGWSYITPPNNGVGSQNEQSIAITSDGEKLYYAAYSDQVAYVAYSNIDGSNFSGWTTLTTLPWGNAKGQIDIAMVGSELYIAAFLMNGGEPSSEKYYIGRIDSNFTNFSGWTEQTNPDGAGSGDSANPAIMTDGKKLYLLAFAHDNDTETLKLASLDLTYQPILSKQGAYELLQNGGGFTLDWAGVPYNFGNISANTWSHVAVTNDGTNLKMYVNGELKRTQSTSVDFNSNSNNLIIGGNGTRYYNGFIDEVKIYPYARSEDEIKQDYQGTGSVRGTSVSVGNADLRSLQNGLVAYWNMEGIGTTGNGVTVPDISGNGYNGTTDDGANNTGINCTTSGKYGGGCDFDGSDDWISTNYVFTEPNSTDAITVSAWIYADTVGSLKTIFSTQPGARFNVTLSPGNAPWELSVGMSFDGSTQTVTGTTTINAGQWYLVTTTYDIKDKKLKLYVNGIFENETVITGAGDLTITSSNLRMGWSALAARVWDGKMDEIRIYNRALSASEVQQLYKWAPGPVAYYNFDEGSGTTLNDRSGNGNTGTLTNGPMWTQGKYGKGLSFDGSDDYVDIGSVSIGPNKEYTYQLWIKPSIDYIYNQEGPDFSFHNYAGTGSQGFSYTQSTNTSIHGFRWRFDDQGGAGTQSITYKPQNLLQGQWYHIAIAWGVGEQKMYINGTDVGSNTDTNHTLGNFTSITKESESFNGSIDEVRIYNYARTQEQILEDMNGNAPAGASQGGNVGCEYSILCLSFDQGYGTTAQDSSGNNLDLTLSSSTSWSNNGKFGKAWLGSGTTYGSITDAATGDKLDFDADDEFSISLWLKSSSATNPSDTEFIINKYFSGGSAAAGYGIFFDASGVLAFGIDDDATSFPEDYAAALVDYYDNQWHHVVATKKGTSQIEIYIDGKLGDTTTVTATGSLANSKTFVLGDLNAADDLYEFKGYIDELRIYPFALSEEQVYTEYNGGKSLVLGSASADSSNNPLNSSSSSYCVPGSSDTCSPPVLELNFEENTGTTAYDTSANGNNGTLTGGPTWAIGHNGVGAGLEFDGSDDTVNAGSASTLDNLSAMTASAWVKATLTQSNRQIIHKAAGNDTSGWTIHTTAANPGRLIFNVDYSTTDLRLASNNNSFAAGEWFFLTVTWDGSTSASNAHMYINGQEITYATQQSASGTRVDDSGHNMAIGSNGSGGDNFYGLIDQVRIYNYARTPAQIAWDYNKGAPIAHYKLDECQGTTAYDSSGNGNHGTITAGATGNTSAGTCDSGSSTQMWANGANGKFNASLDFDGSDDYIDFGNIDYLTGLRNFTVSAWVNLDVTNKDQAIISKGEGVENEIYLWADDVANVSGRTDVFSFGYKYGSGENNFRRIEGVTQYQAGKWYHVAVVKAGDDFEMYVNGKLDNTNSSANGSIYPTDDNLIIGALNNGSSGHTNGQIDDVRIYNYALTETQIKQLYNGGSAIRFN